MTITSARFITMCLERQGMTARSWVAKVDAKSAKDTDLLMPQPVPASATRTNSPHCGYSHPSAHANGPHLPYRAAQTLQTLLFCVAGIESLLGATRRARICVQSIEVLAHQIGNRSDNRSDAPSSAAWRKRRSRRTIDETQAKCHTDDIRPVGNPVLARPVLVLRMSTRP